MNAHAPAIRPSPLVPASAQGPGARVSHHEDLDTPWQASDHPLLLLPVRGTVSLQTDHLEAIVVPGQAAWLPPGARHRLIAHDPVSLQVLWLAEAPEAPDELAVFPAPPLLRAAADEAVRWDDAVSPATRAALADTLAGLVSRWQGHTPPLVLPRASSPRLRRALTWLRIRLERPVGLADAAKAGSMSERTLQRRCRAELGMSLSAWMTRARMLSALELLSEDALPISEIALRCGYQSPAAFTRAFSVQVGRTPSAWRADTRPS